MDFVFTMMFGTIAVVLLTGLICAPLISLWKLYVRKGKLSPRVAKLGRLFCILFCLLVFVGVFCRVIGRYVMDDEIHLAASNGDTGTVEFALWIGVDVNTQFKSFGPTPLMAAATTGQADTVKVLLSHHPDLTLKNNGSTALDMAIANRHPDIVRLLKDAGAK